MITINLKVIYKKEEIKLSLVRRNKLFRVMNLISITLKSNNNIITHNSESY